MAETAKPAPQPATQNAPAASDESRAIAYARARIEMGKYKATAELAEQHLTKLVAERHGGVTLKQFRLARSKLSNTLREAEEGMGKAA